MLPYISSGWKTSLEGFPSAERFYIDFRMLEYPNISGTPVYTLVDSADNRPGTFNMTDGYSTHLITLIDGMSFDLLVYADFDYDVASDQPLFGWYASATQYLKVFYNATTDKITVAWKDGGTERTLETAAFIDGLNDWYRITVVFDTTSPLLYLDGSLEDDSWSGAADALSTNFQWLQLRAHNSTEGLWYLNHVRIFQRVVTNAEIVANYSTVKDEEIFFDLDGNQVGKTRCNIGRFVKGWSYNGAAENDGGSQVANRASITLMSNSGEFADDQYAAFDPTSDIFNGTSAQKYLQQRCRVEIETWYSGTFEPIIRGYVDNGHFSRQTSAGQGTRYWSEVYIGIEDYITMIANTYKGDTVAFDNFFLSSTTKNSLFHEVARLATKKSFDNYLCDTGFESTEVPVELMENGSCENGQVIGASQWYTGPYIRGYGVGDLKCLPASYAGIAAHGGSYIAYGNITSQLAELSTAKSKTYFFHSPGANLRGLTAGVEYTFTAWVYNPSAAGMTSVTLSMADDVNGVTTDSMTATDTWTELSVTHTVHATATVAYCYISGAVTSITAYQQYFYVDDVSLIPSTVGTWDETGSVTFTRDDTYAHTGSRSGKLVFAAAGAISQTLIMEQPLFLNIGDTYTATVYALSAAGFTGTLRLAEADGGGVNDSSTEAISLSGGEGFVRYAVSHTITDGDSDRLTYSIEGDADTVWVDTCGLNFGDDVNLYVVNDKEGETGISRPQYLKRLAYNFCGINADEIDVQHPYAVIPKNESIWEHLKQIADACGARYMGMDNAGVLTLKTHLVDADPTPIETVSVASNIATQLQSETANKITVSGSVIIKNVEEELYWQASTCEDFKEYPYVDKEGKLSYPLHTYDYFPSNGDYVTVKWGE